MSSFYDSGRKIEELFPDDSMEDHVIDATSMWAGSRKPMELNEYLIDMVGGKPKLIFDTIVYPPALYKCVDEAVVNALDNMIRLSGAPRTRHDDNTTTHIDLLFDNTGRVTVINNGRGVPVGYHSVAKMHSVQMIFGVMFKGRKKDDKESKVTGDANRVGIKIANILSTEFTVETVYRETTTSAPVFYSQRWSNHMKCVDPPVIKQMPSATRQYCKVSFMPDYAGMFDLAWTTNTFNTLTKLFRFRAYSAAAYAGFYTNSNCTVSFNNELVPCVCMAGLAALSIGEEQPTKNKASSTVYSTVITPANKCTWEIAVCISANDASNAKRPQITNVNGVNAKAGRHIDYVLKQIIDGVRENVCGKMHGEIRFQPSYVYQNISLFINAQVPGAEWSGQRKDELVVGPAKTADYIVDQATVSKIAAALYDKIMLLIYGKTNVTGMPTKTKIKLDKYQAAKLIKTQPQKCCLLLPEGDSAASLIKTGLGLLGPNKEPYLGFDYYGYLTLGGVIMNVRKQVAVKEIAGKRCIDIGPDLALNKFFNQFIEATGLDLNASYEVGSATYIKERAGLKYGCVIVCTDQDHDGVGFIFPLLCNVLAVFWPNLLASGYVRRWDTPRRRAVPKTRGQVVEFYDDIEFDEWCAANPGAISHYKIDYIKGLASHEPDVYDHMFKTFKQNVVTYNHDAYGETRLEVMFGEDTSKRKKWLAKPSVSTPLTSKMVKSTRIDTTGNLVDCQGYEHAKSNIVQKLWSVIDGMNESGRKVLSGCLKAFKHEDKIKVAILSGHITATEHYQHGESSLQESIVAKGFIAVGGTQLPQIIPRAMLGSRSYGGGIANGDCGAARYVYVSLNHRLTDLLYPAADIPLLEYNTEDGVGVEPKYFVPVLPMAVLESVHTPAHGWKIKMWARDVMETINRVRFLINCYVSDRATLETGLAPIKTHTRGFKGEFRYHRGREYCFGTYVFDPATRLLRITELPLRQWTQRYVDALNSDAEGSIKYVEFEHGGANVKVQMFSEAADYSTADDICIELYLSPVDKATGFDPLRYITDCANGGFADGIEVYFGLYKSMRPTISLLDVDNRVLEYTNYEEPVKRWFITRKAFYIARITRQLVIAQTKLKILTAQIKYIALREELAVDGKDEAVVIELCKTHGLPVAVVSLEDGHRIVNKAKQYIPTDRISAEVFESADASYDYLLNTSDRQRLATAVESRRVKAAELAATITKLEAELCAKPFPGASTWLSELDGIADVVRLGHSLNWNFNAGKYTY
jgi:DNA topoisomerase-2